MIKNFLRIAWRNMGRNKAITSINVIGLSIGITAAIVIFLIARFEYSYDKIAIDGNRVYRVVQDMKFSGIDGHFVNVPAPLSQAIQSQITGIENSIPVLQFPGDGKAKVSINYGGKKEAQVIKRQDGILFTNDQYFSMLPFKWEVGNAKTALGSPFQVVLTESRATQYFPGVAVEDIAGKTITYNDSLHTIVSGVIADQNANTTLQVKEFISFATIGQTNLQKDFGMENWENTMSNSGLYVKIFKGLNADAVEARLNTLYKTKNKFADRDSANFSRLHLQPLYDVHFNALYASSGNRIANKTALKSLFMVAAFLLLLACINFINLTTANSAVRAKEIGIRKTMGSSRKQLIFQFLTETFALTTTACILGCALTPLMIRVFTDFIPPGVSFRPFDNPVIFVFLAGLAAVVSLLAGLYPAFVLSARKTVNVLKKQVLAASGETSYAWVRKSLIVSQFVVAQFFVIGTVVVSKQINYSLNADMGFRKDAILNFKTPGRDTVKSHLSLLINEIRSLPGVELVSKGDVAPAIEGVVFSVFNQPGSDEQQSVQVRLGDTNYLKLYNIPLITGRNILESDTVREIIVNESLSKSLGFSNPRDALGRLVTYQGKSLPIIGVMNDFHESSFHSAVGPMIFTGFDNAAHTIHILLNKQHAKGDWAQTISKIGTAFNKIYPGQDFNYHFLDETIANFYQAEQRTGKLLNWATGLSVLISCMGLIGLAIYIINTRTKEIGVRKVLGASVTNILTLLSKDFMKLVFIAFIIATPVAWWAIHSWLQEFVYRTAVSWYVFIVCGGAMLLLTLVVLSLQIVKVATANPVKSLRSE